MGRRIQKKDTVEAFYKLTTVSSVLVHFNIYYPHWKM